jgi:predicted nucleic acid-binding protein
VSKSKRVVLDANILIRAVFGERVLALLNSYEDSVEFYTPDVCLADARKHIPSIAMRRGVEPILAEAVLKEFSPGLIQVGDRSLYEELEDRARARISAHDANDWPVAVTALLLDAPIWTEDRDFFGSGIATWTSNKIELYLRDA